MLTLWIKNPFTHINQGYGLPLFYYLPNFPSSYGFQNDISQPFTFLKIGTYTQSTSLELPINKDINRPMNIQDATQVWGVLKKDFTQIKCITYLMGRW